MPPPRTPCTDLKVVVGHDEALLRQRLARLVRCAPDCRHLALWLVVGDAAGGFGQEKAGGGQRQGARREGSAAARFSQRPRQRLCPRRDVLHPGLWGSVSQQGPAAEGRQRRHCAVEVLPGVDQGGGFYRARRGRGGGGLVCCRRDQGRRAHDAESTWTGALCRRGLASEAVERRICSQQRAGREPRQASCQPALKHQSHAAIFFMRQSPSLSSSAEATIITHLSPLSLSPTFFQPPQPLASTPRPTALPRPASASLAVSVSLNAS